MNLELLEKGAPVGLPLGFADQVMDLEMKLEEEESLELIQILTQMYKVNFPLLSQIAVDFYIDNDVKKAAYFQRKLNNLSVKAIHAQSVEDKPKVHTKIHFTQTVNK